MGPKEICVLVDTKVLTKVHIIDRKSEKLLIHYNNTILMMFNLYLIFLL